MKKYLLIAAALALAASAAAAEKKAGKDEALDDLNPDLHFRFVFRSADTGRDDGGLVMFRQCGIGGVQIRLVAAGPGYATLEIIDHNAPGHRSHEGEGSDV